MGRRKVRFIEPGARPGRLYHSWIGRWPTLGPVALATMLRGWGFDAAVYNENISGLVTDSTERYADICSADVIGLSLMTPTACRGYEIADRLRKDAPRATIVMGGIHPSMMPHEALRTRDLVVCGEAENAIADIAAGTIRQGIIRPHPPRDLDALPRLDHRVLVDFERLVATHGGLAKYELPVMTSRGCPHGCTYCSVTRMFGRKVRRQSVAHVVSDLEFYAGSGFRRFFFYDDNFTSDHRWTCGSDAVDVAAERTVQFADAGGHGLARPQPHAGGHGDAWPPAARRGGRDLYRLRDGRRGTRGVMEQRLRRQRHTPQTADAGHADAARPRDVDTWDVRAGTAARPAGGDGDRGLRAGRPHREHSDQPADAPAGNAAV